jgi:hypothetical protein
MVQDGPARGGARPLFGNPSNFAPHHPAISAFPDPRAGANACDVDRNDNSASREPVVIGAAVPARIHTTAGTGS